MLKDGRCDLCGSDITCACGQYSSVQDRPVEEKLEAIQAENAKLKAEVERLRDEYEEAHGDLLTAYLAGAGSVRHRADKLKAEVERLRNEYGEYRATLDRIVADDTAADEEHCGCCVMLRAEVERLRERAEASEHVCVIEGITSDQIGGICSCEMCMSVKRSMKEAGY